MALTAPTNKLTAQAVQDSFDQLLYLDNAAGMASNTLKIISTENSKSCLSISENHLLIRGVDSDNAALLQVTKATSGASLFTIDASTPLISAGVNDVGVDVKFFGATSGKYMLWDESQDTLAISGQIDFNAQGSGESISGDGTDLILNSGSDITLTATNDVNIPVNVGLRFGDGNQHIETDNTDLTITSDVSINLSTPQIDIGLNTSADIAINLLGTNNDFAIAYDESAKKLAFETTALVIDGANNRVGIGTASPYSPLEVVGWSGGQSATMNITRYDATATTYAALNLRKSNHNTSGTHTTLDSGDIVGGINFYGSDGDEYRRGAFIQCRTEQAWSNSQSAASIRFNTVTTGEVEGGGGSGERMRIDHNGNIGIGTSNPTENLHIYGAGVQELLIESSDEDSIIDIEAGAVGKDSIIQFNANGDASAASIVYDHNATPASAKMQFLVGDNATTAATILGDGKVGIGTATPAVPLHVVKSEVEFVAKFHNTATGATSDAVVVESDSPNAAAEVFRVMSSGNANLFQCMGDGNVGIGTGTPDGKLEVVGAGASLNTYISCYSDNESHTGHLHFRKSDNVEATPQVLDNSAVLGAIIFSGMDADGGEFINGAKIVAIVDGTPGNDSMPTYLGFYTNTGAADAVLNAYVHEGGDFYTNDGSVSSISSDERLKKDIRDFTHGLSVVNQLNPVYYKFNGKGGRNEDEEDRIGMLANVVKDIAPDTVKTYTGDLDEVETELYTMCYDKLIFYAINAIQELSAKVEALENL